MKMKGRELMNLGIPKGLSMKVAQKVMGRQIQAGVGKHDLRKVVRQVVADPKVFIEDSVYGELAQTLLEVFQVQSRYLAREESAPWKQWGDDLEAGAVQQMVNACQLPVAVSGALMPDAHQGYGLPIGGVLATKNCVIPYAVGVDIACRMKLTVLELPLSVLEEKEESLRRAIDQETAFGIGAGFKRKRDHQVMDEDWSVTLTTKTCRDKAWKQLGSSGSGNHFVEFGTLTMEHTALGLDPGRYVALLSHSGSRGAGATVAGYYSKSSDGGPP